MATTARRISGNEFTPDDIIEVSVDYPGIMYVCEQRIEVVSGPDVTHGGAAASTEYLHYKNAEIDADEDGNITTTMNGVTIGGTTAAAGTFTTVTTSGNISGSVSSTGSFGHIQVAKNFLPTTDNNSDLGSANKRWANIHSADLQLSNEGTEGNEIDGTTGNWTIQEGEDDLYLLNRKNGKKYRFKLQEID